MQDGLTVFGSMSYVRGTNCSPVQYISPADGYAPHGQVVGLGGSEGLPGIYPLNGTVGVRIFEPTEDRWMMEFNSRLVARQDHLAVSLSEIGTPGFAVFGLRGYYRVQKNVRLSVAVDESLQPVLHGTRLPGDHQSARGSRVREGAGDFRPIGSRRSILTNLRRLTVASDSTWHT